MDSTKIVASVEAENTGEAYTTRVLASGRSYIVDEPEALGGQNEGAAPAEYLCMALASCKTITIRMYAKRKNWKLHKISVKVDMIKGENTPSSPNTFLCSINLTGELTDEQEKRLLEISKICPIDRLLSKPSEIVTALQ